jgi:LysR family hydrogen peroxide-inducible transcriptional activator
MRREESTRTIESIDRINLSALTLQQLRCVVAVERHRSFRDAARACNVSQPALSAQIKKAEDVLGVVLFDRARQPIVVTRCGSLVATQARVVLDQVDRIGAIASGSESLAGRHHLGIIPSLLPTLLPRFLPELVARHPNLELGVEGVKTTDLVRRLREGTLDAGLAATPLDVPGINERVVFHESFHVYVSPGHPFAERKHLRQADLVDELVWLLSEGHCFRTQVLHLCSVDRSGRQGPRVAYDGDSFDTLIQLVDAGLGITILPELLSQSLPPDRQKAQLRRFVSPEPVREISLLISREVAGKALSEALIASIRAAIPRHLHGRPRRGLILAPVSPP